MKYMKRKIRNYFLTGLLVIIPIFGSIGLIGWVFVKITNFLLPPTMMQTSEIVFWRFVSLLILFLFIILVGVLAQSLLVKRLLGLGEKIVVKIPLLSKVYVALKQISNAIWGQNKTILRGVVLIEYPRRGLYSIGFATSESQGEVQEKTKEKVINIFIPTTPNPTSGLLILVPEKDVTYLDMTIEEGLKLVISGGAVVPEKRTKTPTEILEKKTSKSNSEQNTDNHIHI
jgi:uncharacterized membrane protein